MSAMKNRNILKPKPLTKNGWIQGFYTLPRNLLCSCKFLITFYEGTKKNEKTFSAVLHLNYTYNSYQNVFINKFEHWILPYSDQECRKVFWWNYNNLMVFHATDCTFEIVPNAISMK